jgi:hypothetical protein
MSKKSSYRSEKKEFDQFREEFRKYVEKLGLKGWVLDFRHKIIKDDGDNFIQGSCTTDLVQRLATIEFNKKWYSTEPTEEVVKVVAKHECLELFFARLEHMAESRYIREGEIREEVHNMISILENLI